jgi:hypothetical protein
MKVSELKKLIDNLPGEAEVKFKTPEGNCIDVSNVKYSENIQTFKNEYYYGWYTNKVCELS